MYSGTVYHRFTQKIQNTPLYWGSNRLARPKHFRAVFGSELLDYNMKRSSKADELFSFVVDSRICDVRLCASEGVPNR